MKITTHNIGTNNKFITSTICCSKKFFWFFCRNYLLKRFLVRKYLNKSGKLKSSIVKNEKDNFSVFTPWWRLGDHHRFPCIWFACKQNNSTISFYFSKAYRKTFSVLRDLFYIVTFFNVFFGGGGKFQILIPIPYVLQNFNKWWFQ